MPAKLSTRRSSPTGTHVFGRPRLNQKSLAFTGAPSKPGNAFQPLPKPTGKPPFHLDLKDILPADYYAAIAKAQRLVFQVDGDLGGIKFAVPQERVAQGLEQDFLASPPDPSVNPAFFYVRVQHRPWLRAACSMRGLLPAGRLRALADPDVIECPWQYWVKARRL
jgi:hypothetical protein